MSGKAPIYLKRGSRKGKKEKLRDVLSSDMISPPLGDFRHTVHIGSGGGEDDVFGDLSFLQGKFHLLPGRQEAEAPERSGSAGRPVSICGPPLSSGSSPLLKNALSLPIMGEAHNSPMPMPDHAYSQQQAPPPKPPRLHLDDRRLSSPPMVSHCSLGSSGETSPVSSPNGQCMLQEEPCLEDTVQEQPYLSHAGSLLSLHLDLGPSILDDVLQIMEKHRMGHLNGPCLHGGHHEIFT